MSSSSSSSSDLETDPSPLSKECSEQCPLFGYHPPIGHYDRGELPPSSHSPVDQVVQASKLYRPIKDWQTRVIELQPGVFGSELRMDLRVVDIILFNGVIDHERQVKLTYQALSYCWGLAIFDRNVTINGLAYPITENLYIGLQYLRSTE